MPTNTYKLLNPYILGSMETSVTAPNSNDAAKLLYTNFSKHLKNKLPGFLFSFAKVSSKDPETPVKHYTFKVSEEFTGDDGDKINYKLVRYNGKVDPNNFLKNLNKFKLKMNNIGEEPLSIEAKQTGGRKKKSKSGKKIKEILNRITDDDDDSSSSSEDYIYPRRKYRRYKYINYYDPIYYYYYDPFYYYGLSRTYVPVFADYLNPTVLVNLDSFW